MDSIKNSSTSVSIVDGYDVVSYRAFASTSSIDGQIPKTAKLDGLSRVEAQLREAKRLVYLDRPKQLLWIFEPGTNPLALGHGVLQMLQSQQLVDLRLAVQIEGVMEAADLAKYTGRPRHAQYNTQHRSAASTPLTMQAANTHTFYVDQDGTRHAVAAPTGASNASSVYEYFMSAVVGVISYYLSRSHHVLPLNYRTFVFYPTATESTDEPADDVDLQTIAGGLSCVLVTLDAHLSTAGTLVVSTAPSTTRVYQLETILSLCNAPDDFLGEKVRISPCGLAARYVGHAPSVVGGESLDLDARKRRRAMQKWRAAVLRWLRMKGLTLPNMDEDGKWVRIQFQQTPRKTSDSSTPLPSECLWPASLCLLYRVGRPDTDLSPLDINDPPRHGDGQDPGVLTGQEAEKSGFDDPLREAQSWYMKKPDREKAIEARSKERQAQSETAQSPFESILTYSSSPLGLYGPAYGNLQIISGVYQTPPDGVVPWGLGGHAVVESTEMSHAESQGESGHGSSCGDGLSVREHAAMVGFQPRCLWREPDTPIGGPDIARNDDVLVGDVDEDMFDGNNVTEADFSFFDDEHINAFGDIVDASQHQKPIEQRKHGNDQAQSMLESYPSTVQAAGSTQAQTWTIPSGPTMSSSHKDCLHVSDTDVPQDCGAVPSLRTQGSDEAKHEASGRFVFPQDPSPPLSPAQINKILFGSARVDVGEETDEIPLGPSVEACAVFDSVKFSQEMQHADSKYTANGRFFFSSKSRSPDYHESSVQLFKPISITSNLTPAKISDSAKGATLAEGTSDLDIGDTGSESTDCDSNLPVNTDPYNQETDPIVVPVDIGIKIPASGQEELLTAGTPAAGTPATQVYDTRCQDTDSDDWGSDWPPVSSFEPSPSDSSLADLPPPALEIKRHSRVEARLRRESLSLAPAASTGFPNDRPGAVADGPARNPRNTINVAQILADQVIYNTLVMIPEDDESQSVWPDIRSSSLRRLNAIKIVQGSIRNLFQQSVDCDVLGYASIQDFMPESSAASQDQQRPVLKLANSRDPHAGVLFPISTPYVRLRRGDDIWDVLPPALSFWETLGLSPMHGPRNIAAYCIYPCGDDLISPTTTFLDNMATAYESHRLGVHVRGPDIEHLAVDGLVRASANGFGESNSDAWKPTSRICLDTIYDACLSLGRRLSKVDFRRVTGRGEATRLDAIVIYLVNPFSDLHGLWQLCAAFRSLYQAYRSPAACGALGNARPQPVLQMVPVKYITSFATPVVLEPRVLTRLVHEVYNRCPPTDPGVDCTGISIRSAPSIQLEHTLPMAIPFKRAVEPPSNLLHDNSYFHVGYAIDLHGSWLTAAWTDDPGKHQHTASYCLKGRSFAEVAREIHETTIEIMSSRRGTWRLCIAKAGVMEQEELASWQALVTDQCLLMTGMALISFDACPSLNITSTPSTFGSTANNHSATAGVATPRGDTPQSGATPDAHGFTPTATPSDASTGAPAVDQTSHPDARLIDLTDESWGMILQHRLHNSTSTTEFSPALASGYLIKRGADARISSGAASPEYYYQSESPHGPIIVGVNLLWIFTTISGHDKPQSASATRQPEASAVPAAADNGSSSIASNICFSTTGIPPLVIVAGADTILVPVSQARTMVDTMLGEILISYRGLGLLARLRGMRGTRGGAVPWHVAAAMRGVKALEKSLGHDLEGIQASTTP